MWLAMSVWTALSALEVATIQRSAAEHFPVIVAAAAEVSVARGAQLAAQGGFDPLFNARVGGDPLGYYRNFQADTWIEQPTPLWGTSFIGGYRVGLGDYPEYKGGLATNQYGEVRAGLRTPLLRDGWIDRRRAAIRRAELGVDVSIASRDLTTLDVMRAASLRYYAWVGAGLRRKLAEQMLVLAQERDQQIAARLQSGDLAQVERLDNERTIAQREALFIAATRALEQAAIELSLYHRDGNGEPLLASIAELPAQLPPPQKGDEPLSAMIDRALAARPDLKRAELTLRQTQVDLDLQRNQLWPTLDVRLTASQDFGPGSPTRAPFELTAGLVLEVPLLFRAQRGAVQAADSTTARVAAQLRLQRDRVVAEVRDACSAFDAALLRVTAANREATLAAEIARLERARFKLGESTILVVNLRETASLEAQARVIDASVDAYRALTELRAVTAAPAA